MLNDHSSQCRFSVTILHDLQRFGIQILVFRHVIRGQNILLFPFLISKVLVCTEIYETVTTALFYIFKVSLFIVISTIWAVQLGRLTG